MGSGAFNLLLTLGAGGFMVVVFLVLKQPKFFDYSLWTAAGWSAFASIWRLVGVFH
jgi:hypothetical protein